MIYLLAALAIPGLPFFLLLILMSVVLLILSLQRRSPLRLVWRTRWLLLVLLFGYAYSLPGEPILSVLGGMSPSLEGGIHGIGQAARLIVLLLCLDMLVLCLPANELLAGLYQLMRSLSWIGVDSRRAALRLGLTLRAIEDLEHGRGNLKGLLNLDFQVGLSQPLPKQLPQRIQLQLRPLGLIDVAIPGLILVVLFGVWLTLA